MGDAPGAFNGIWYDRERRIAVVPDSSGAEGTLAGAVVACDRAARLVEGVRATYRRIADNKYETVPSTATARAGAPDRLPCAISRHPLNDLLGSLGAARPYYRKTDAPRHTDTLSPKSYN
jgi:hypothetical protein